MPARGRPIRECLSIGTRNLVAFPCSAAKERERERERERKREGEERERDRKRKPCGRCGSVAFIECHLTGRETQ